MAAPGVAGAASWDVEIRAREEALRAAFLDADLRALDELIADDCIVNSPLHKVVTKALLLQSLETGRLRHLSFDSRIETMRRHGDTVVVMGGERVVEGPGRVCSTRRFTNLWQLADGRWRAAARHVHVVAREGADEPGPASPGPMARERAGAPERAYQPTP
jgi:ketosteroid isomerase-like protein